MKNQFQTLLDVAKELGIEIHIARKGDRAKIGIHKLYPDMNAMQDALDVAERDNFPAIYIHNANTWKN